MPTLSPEKSKKCLKCGAVFYKSSKRGYIEWSTYKYCSDNCRPRGSEGRINPMLGRKHSTIVP